MSTLRIIFLLTLAVIAGVGIAYIINNSGVIWWVFGNGDPPKGL
jgi:hypothetical protein